MSQFVAFNDWEIEKVKMNNVLYMLYQFDEKYVPYTAVSITSLLENNKDIQIFIYALAENVTEESMNRLRRIVKKYGAAILFIDTESLIKRMEKIGIPKYRGAYATNFKLFITQIIPENVERLLYIDSDTLVVGNLKNLLEIDMNNCPIGMVLDSLGDQHARLIGLSGDNYYVNGGVILYDLCKWKECKCTERIVEYAETVRAQFMSPDQDLINLVLQGEIFILDPKYNLQPIHKVYAPELYRRFWKWKVYYEGYLIEQAVQEPVIHHCFRYLGQFPWHKDSLHPDVKEFDFYLERTDWPEFKKEVSDCSSIIFKLERLLYKVLPQMIFLWFFKISYEFFIWRANRNSLNLQKERSRAEKYDT